MLRHQGERRRELVHDASIQGKLRADLPQFSLKGKIGLDVLQHRRPRQVRIRVHRIPAQPDFEMQMRRGHDVRRLGLI